MTEEQCPKCQYNGMVVNFYYKPGYQVCYCPRCGHHSDSSEEELQTGPPVVGACGYKMKEAVGVMGSYTNLEELLEDLKPHLEEMETCFYTFQKDGVWYQRDVLTGKDEEYANFTTEQTLRPEWNMNPAGSAQIRVL